MELVVELGQVADHGQFVGGGTRGHLLPRHHRGDPQLCLGHVKRQLVVLGRIQRRQRVKITEEKKIS